MMKQLQIVAKELNEKLGLEPAIEIDSSQEYLENMIREAIQLVVVADELTPTTWEVLRKYGWKSPNKPTLPSPTPPPPSQKQEKEISLLGYFDQLLLKGGTLEELLTQMSQESKRRGKKSYQVKWDITAHISERRKRGYNIQEEGGVYKLEKIL